MFYWEVKDFAPRSGIHTLKTIWKNNNNNHKLLFRKRRKLTPQSYLNVLFCIWAVWVAPLSVLCSLTSPNCATFQQCFVWLSMQQKLCVAETNRFFLGCCYNNHGQQGWANFGTTGTLKPVDVPRLYNRWELKKEETPNLPRVYPFCLVVSNCGFIEN